MSEQDWLKIGDLQLDTAKAEENENKKIKVKQNEIDIWNIIKMKEKKE